MPTATVLPNSTTAIPAPLDLPKNFEEYDESRRKSFMRVHDFKQAGGRLVGTLCSYAPAEVIEAAGAACVSPPTASRSRTSAPTPTSATSSWARPPATARRRCTSS